MAYRIYIPRYSGECAKGYLRERGYEIIERNELALDPSEMEKCDGILLRAVPYVDEAALQIAPRLKVIARYGAGYDNVDIDACTRHGVRVTYAPTANYISVAEHTMLMLLECAKNIGRINSEFLGEKHNFGARDTDCGHDIAQKTLGLIGLGRIGHRLAKLALGFDMKVIAYDPALQPGLTEDGVDVRETRDEVLRTSDFVSLHLPGTQATRHFIDLDALKMMKPDAYLLNCARGIVVCQEDLVAALRQGIIAGAAIDVYEEEPPGADNPLLHMENVYCTPHMAGATKEALDRAGLHAAMGIDDVLNGREPQWPVNHLN